jgi:phage gp36-like protein
MPAFATESDLGFDEADLISLTESLTAVGVKDAATITRALEAGADRIRSILEGTYALPAAPPYPAALVRLNVALSRRELFRHRPLREVPKQIVDDAAAAEADLWKYVEGKMVLPGVSRIEADTGPSPSEGVLHPRLKRKMGRSSGDGIA